VRPYHSPGTTAMQSIEPVLWPMAEDGLAGAPSFCPRRLSAPGAAIQAFHAEFPTVPGLREIPLGAGVDGLTARDP
jgi:hypothetical protein